MVFSNTVDAVESVAKILHTARIHYFCYHINTSLEEGTKNLVYFREKGGVLAYTDATARGLGISTISHVIQVRGLCEKAKEILLAVTSTASFTILRSFFVLAARNNGLWLSIKSFP